MPLLEIVHYTGDVQRRPLSKQSPLTIGSHPSNDLQIDEDGVEVMHCRIAWARNGFEAVAAGVDPLEINGVPVQRAELKEGDVLRFGSVDVHFRSDGPGEPAAAAVPRAAASRSAARSSKKIARSIENPGMDEDVFEQLAAESTAAPATRGPARSVRRPTDDETGDEAEQSAAGEAPDGDADEGDAMSDRVRTALRSQQYRPGEEDPLRSPLVLGLALGTLALTLTGAIFYFIATRHTTAEAFGIAKQLYDEGKYAPANEKLNEFIILYPNTDQAVEARQLLGLSRVRQHIEGAAPNYPEGLEKLRALIDEHKDLPGFEGLHPEISGHARTISVGAATQAGRQLKPELLETSRQARTLLTTYSPKDAPPTVTLEQIERALRTSEAAILRDDVYRSHVAGIERALSAGRPLEALKERRNLLLRYAEFERDRQVVALTERTLEDERSRVVFEEISRDALVDDHDWPAHSLTLAFQGRTRTDEVAVGKSVTVLAQDCAYGVEFVTGQPLWRRNIGYDTPFFPLLEDNLPSVILFDARRRELLRLHQATGQLVWRQPFDELVSGRPLLTNDTIYVPTESGRLLALDVDTGQLTGQLAFSQKISGPVELGDQQRIVVAGDEEVLYTLTKRPFACERISYVGHAPDSISAPLLAAGPYLLLIENGANEATLRLLTGGGNGAPFAEAATGKVVGRVTDSPAIRGRDLFVPSSGERVTAFSLSDDPGQPPLTRGPFYQAESRRPGPIYLMTGPDRQLWMATGALSRLRLTTDSLQPDGDPVAPGLAAQPLQFLSGYLFHGRRPPNSQAVRMTRTDRDEMTSDWQAILGGEILALSSRAGPSLNLAAVTGAGQAFRISDRQFQEGEFLKDATERLPIPADLQEPLQAGRVSNERLAVACGGAEPRIWIINIAGQIEGSALLPASPQARPASVGNYVVVPLKGRLHVVRLSGQSPLQDYALPTDDEQSWIAVEPLGDDRAVAVTAEGRLLLLRVNQTPRPHLGESARVDLGEFVALAPAARDGLFAVVDGSNTVSVFEGERLESRGRRTLPQAVSSPPFIAGGRVFVESGLSQLHCLEAAPELPVAWSADIAASPLTGVLLHQDRLYVAQQNGLVLILDPANGQLLGERDVLSSLSSGPYPAGNSAVVATVDGTLIRVE